MTNYPEDLANYYFSKYDEESQALNYIKKSGNIESFKENLIFEFKKLEHIIFQYEKSLEADSFIINQCYFNILPYELHKDDRVSMSLFKEFPYSKMKSTIIENEMFPKKCYSKDYLYQTYLSLSEKEYFVFVHKQYLNHQLYIKEFDDTIQYDIAQTLIDFILDKIDENKEKASLFYLKIETIYLQSVLISQLLQFIFKEGLQHEYSNCDLFSTEPNFIEKLNLSHLKTDVNILNKIVFIKEKIEESNKLLSINGTTINDIHNFFLKLGIKVY